MLRAHAGLLAVGAEQVQDLDNLVTCRAEPMGFRGVEFRDFSGPEYNLVFAEDQA